MAGETLALVYLSVARLLTYAGFFGLAGTVTARLAIVPAVGVGGRVSPPVRRALEQRLTGFALAAAGLLVVATAGRLYAQTYATFGLDEPVTLALLELTAVESRWGGRWRWQVVAAGVGLVGAVAARLTGAAGWWLAAGSVIGVAASFPLTGHAIAHPDAVWLSWSLQSVHGLAAGLWIGTLAAVFSTVGIVRRVSATDGDHVVAGLVHAFSPWAVAAVSVTIVSGLWTTGLYIVRVSDLWSTGWGRGLGVKILLAAATGAVGAYNWRRLRPNLGTEPSTTRLIRSVRWELACAVGVLVATAFVVHLALPLD